MDPNKLSSCGDWGLKVAGCLPSLSSCSPAMQHLQALTLGNQPDSLSLVSFLTFCVTDPSLPTKTEPQLLNSSIRPQGFLSALLSVQEKPLFSDCERKPENPDRREKMQTPHRKVPDAGGLNQQPATEVHHQCPPTTNYQLLTTNDKPVRDQSRTCARKLVQTNSTTSGGSSVVPPDARLDTQHRLSHYSNGAD